MASDLTVQTIRGPGSGANANKVIVPSGQTLTLVDKLGYSNLPSGTIVQVQSTVSNVSMVSGASQTFVNTGLIVFITPRFANSRMIIVAQSHIFRPASGHSWHRIINHISGNTSGVRGHRDVGGAYHEDAPIIWHEIPNSTSQQKYEIQIADRDASTDQYFNDGGGYQSGMIVYEVVA
jgi:hypothetical protein